jgi:hypothetical protein
MKSTVLLSAVSLLAVSVAPNLARAERRRHGRAAPVAAPTRSTVTSNDARDEAPRSARTAPSSATQSDRDAPANGYTNSGTGAAGGGGVLQPGTRPAFVVGGLGFSVGGGAAFRLQQNIGTHFSGNSSGPWIAGELNETISGAFGMTFGARFGWDIPIGPRSLYITPNLGAGAGFFAGGQDPLGVIDFNLGADVRLVLFDRVALFARPLSVGVSVLPALPNGGVSARYEFLLGAGATF